MATLRLYLVDGWPERQRNCEWALVDGGRIVRRGCSLPEHWPAAERVEGMLDPALLGCYRVRLPDKLREGRDRLAAYALEDQLLEDPERYHFAVGDDSPAGTRVLAMARARLAALTAALAGLGRAPARLVAAAELLPQGEGEWLLWRSPAGGLVLQTDARGACLVDRVADIASLVAGAAPSPSRLRLLVDRDLAAAVTAAGLPLALVNGAPFDWAAADWDQATNLLAGAFRPRQGLGAWRRAAWLAGAALVLYTVVACGQWAALAWRQAALKDSVQDLARAALAGQPLVAPLPQLVSTADRQQHRRGESGVGDFLVLVQRAVDLAGAGTPQEINYETGRLIMQVASLDPEKEAAMRESLTVAGLELRVARQANGVRIAIAVDAGGEQP